MQDAPEQEANPEVAAASTPSEDAVNDASESHAQHLPSEEDAELDEDDGDDLTRASQQQQEEEEYAAPAAPHPELHEQATTLHVDVDALWRQACETHLDDDQEDESGAEAQDPASLARRSRYRAASMAPSLGARTEDDKAGPKTDGQPDAAAGAKEWWMGAGAAVWAYVGLAVYSESNLHPGHMSHIPLRRARTGPCL